MGLMLLFGGVGLRWMKTFVPRKGILFLKIDIFNPSDKPKAKPGLDNFLIISEYVFRNRGQGSGCFEHQGIGISRSLCSGRFHEFSRIILICLGTVLLILDSPVKPGNDGRLVFFGIFRETRGTPFVYIWYSFCKTRY